MLTEEEKEYLVELDEVVGICANAPHLEKLRAIIDRLLAENEDYFRIIEDRGRQITDLCDKLDAIKKAWEATMDKASDDVFEALDRLIGGEE